MKNESRKFLRFEFFVVAGIFVFLFLFFNSVPVLAQTLDQGLGEFGVTAGYGQESLPQIVGRIVKIALSLLGLIAVIIIIIGGIVWMTSGGAAEKVEKARKIIVSGIIGFLIVVSAYAIVSFIISKLGGVTDIIVGDAPHCTPGFCCASGWRCDLNGDCQVPDTLCASNFDQFKIEKIVTSHEGENDNQNVHLCSGVQSFFNSGVNADKIQDLVESGELRIESDVCVGGSADGKKCNPPVGGEGVSVAECQTGGGSCQGEKLDGAWCANNNTVSFKHKSECGQKGGLTDFFNTYSSYSSYFPKQILDRKGRVLQDCLASGGCVETAGYFIWNFATGETTDTVPPKIISSAPIFDKNSEDYPDINVSRKPNIRVRFSEPVDSDTIGFETEIDGEYYTYPLAGNIWLAEINKQDGEIIKTLPAENWEVIYDDNGFRINLRNEILLESFTWYRLHVENIEDLCLNKMSGPVEWEFQTNDRAPGVDSWNPKGENVCPDSNIALVFSTNMYDYLVRVTISNAPGDTDDLVFEMRPSQAVDDHYRLEIKKGENKIGVFEVLDPGEGNNNFRVFSFNPEDNLIDNTAYNVGVKTTLIIDRVGNMLEHNWNFTTSTLKDCLCSPWISHLDPSEGGKGECLTVYGSCFTGTDFQPATPSSLEFILGGVSTKAEIEGYGKKYLTTVIPLSYVKGDRPQAQATITYSLSKEKFASDLPNLSAEFFVNSDEESAGPCLFTIKPEKGFPGKTLVDLNGIRFGSESAVSQVKFYFEKSAVYNSWSETKVQQVLVPNDAQTGKVAVINEKGISNGLPFNVFEYSMPVIENITPEQGANNPLIPTYVTIRGQNFGVDQGLRFVKFGEVKAEVGCNNWSNNEIVVIVPEELEMDADYKVSVVDPEMGSSNEVTFKVRNEFNPAICRLAPNHGKTGDRTSIQGVNFGDTQGESYVGFGLQDIKTINHDSWFNNKIDLVVPEIFEPEPKVMVYVPSPIEQGNPLKSSNPVTFYKSPVIERVSPESGPRQTWVTIKGQNFGSIPGKVYFRYYVVDTLAEELPAYCGQTWSEEQIIVEVPRKLPVVPEDASSYKIMIYVETAAGIESNLVEWQVDKTPLAPALCLMEPEQEYPGFSPMTIMGVRFDLGADDLERQLIFNDNQRVEVLNWVNNGEIGDIAVPGGAKSGEVIVKKNTAINCRLTCDGFLFAGNCFGKWIEVCDQGWVSSNPLYFKSLEDKVGPGDPAKKKPRVVEESGCLTNIQSPSPWPESLKICFGSGIAARFDEKVMSSTLSLANVIVKKCNLGSEKFNSQSCNDEVKGNISLLGRELEPLDTASGFIFTPENFLEKNYWYQVILKSGEKGIKDVDGYQLDGNENNYEDGSPRDDYQWRFKTDSSDQSCSVKNVLLEEVVPEGEIRGLVIYTGKETRNYHASAISQDCQILVRGVDWNWESSNPFAAVAIKGVVPYEAAAVAKGSGKTKIQATAVSVNKTEVSEDLDLIVATKPEIIGKNPGEDETAVCRNVLISAIFNQEMDNKSLNGETVELLSESNNSKMEIKISESFDEGKWETRIFIQPQQALNSNKKYKVKLKAPFVDGENENRGIRTKYDIPLDKDVEWSFTTGEEICQLSFVEITAVEKSDPKIVFTGTPATGAIFYQKDKTVDFIAEAKDKNGDGIVGIAGLYDWEWSWNLSDGSVAKLDNSNEDKKTGLVTAKNKNGFSDVIATAKITTDGINSSRTVDDEYVGQGRIQVFICENPWQYEDASTHFTLFYCRDNEPLLPELFGLTTGSLTPPTSLQATAVGPNQIDLLWKDKSYNENEFVIERGRVEAEEVSLLKRFYIAAAGENEIIWQEIGKTGKNINSYSDVGLKPGKEYYYRVKACNNSDCSNWSKTVSVVTFVCLPGETETRECSITNGIGSQIRICSALGNWDDVAWSGCSLISCNSGFYQKGNQCVAVSAAGLRIFITAGEWQGSLGGVSGADTKCQTDNNNPDTGKIWKALIGTPQRQKSGLDWVLMPNTNYYREEGSILIDTTDTNAWFTFNLNNAISPLSLGVWTGLTSNGSYHSGYNCATWSSPAVGSADYGSVFYKDIKAINHNTSYCASRYHLYCVEQPSLPLSPSDLFASAVSQSQINLIWMDNSNNENEFVIERGEWKIGRVSLLKGFHIAAIPGGDSIVWQEIDKVGKNVTSYSDTRLEPGKEYYYRIKACHSFGCSNWSNTTSATTHSESSPSYPYY